MKDNFKIYVAQLNATVGAIDDNCEAIIRKYSEASELSADLVITPELSVIGYPPEDLVLKPFFIRRVEAAIEHLAQQTAGQNNPGLIVGVPWWDGDILRNASLLLADGAIQAVRFKNKLPNYGVFDEKRVFTEASPPLPMEFRGLKLGVMVCEDMWFPDAADHLADNGADIILVPTCSPYDHRKMDERLSVARTRVAETGLPLVFCNQIGGQDELVFEGASFVLQADGELTSQLAAWSEDSLLTDWNMTQGKLVCETRSSAYLPKGFESMYQAMVMGLKDYVNKNYFPGVVLGLSGGIDSALSAAVAVDALGPDKVHCVMMPTKYTSGESLKDAKECAEALGVRYDIIEIKPGVDAFDDMLADAFANKTADTTEENIQSRLRGLVLMSLSNKFGNMVLTTGNKSEMSVGYATLYGDMCGGYSVLKDVYKTDVFALSHWRNGNVPKGGLGPAGEVVPENIIIKPPTAELREDQKDEDSLPSYDELDAMLKGLVDEELSVSEIAQKGFDASEVARIEHLLYIAEYKRRQAPPGVKITTKNFGRDRRYPITNGFRSAKR